MVPYPTLSPEEEDRLIGPTERLASSRKFNKFPNDTPIQLNRYSGEPGTECGLYSDKKGRGFDHSDDIGGRIWEGNMIKSKDQFPWTVCIKAKSIHIVKYQYIVVDNQLYIRPSSMLFEHQYSRHERISTMKAKGERYIPSSRFSQSCSGSFILDDWILTAAHCVEGYVNEAYFKISLDTLCYGGDAEIIEMSEDRADRNIFVPKKWTDFWDISFETWKEKNLGLLSVEAAKTPAAEDMTKFADYSRKRMLSFINNDGDTSGSMSSCILESKLYPNIGEDTGDQVETGSDIALIKLSKKSSKQKTICFRTSIGIDMSIFNQHIYQASYGSKGTFEESEDRDTSLTWISMLSMDEINRRDMNVTHQPNRLGLIYDNIHYHHMANVDFIDGHLVTSATCSGDSGGPVFVYASTPCRKGSWLCCNQTYAIQIAVLSGAYGGVSINFYYCPYYLLNMCIDMLQ